MKGIIPYVLGFFTLWLLTATGCKKKQDEDRPAVKITGYYPNSGKAGTLITVKGEGFGTDLPQYTAKVSETATEVISATTTAIVLRAPGNAASGAITVTYMGQVYPVGDYTYQSLSVQRIFPFNGPAGSSVNISGEGFGSTGKPAQVSFNGKEALVISASDTLLIAEVPEEAGTGPIVVNVDGKEARGQDFTYQAITAIKPLKGGKGTKVSISGTGFETTPANNQVTFNGKPAEVVASTSEKLVVLAPDAVATGPLSVTINGQRTSGPVFTVVPPPVVSVVSPLSGPQGTEMTISGTQFSDVKEENKVFINGVEIPINTAGEKVLTLTIPGGTGSGPVKVIVNDQEAVGPLFKDQTLGIATVSPESGLEGTIVKVTGTGFSKNAIENAVYFNGVPATVTAASETELTLTVPAGVSTGELKIAVKGATAAAPKLFRRAGVMTLAGGPGSDVFTTGISRLAVDGQKNVYVSNNTQLFKITPDGHVTLFAGQKNGQAGRKDGTGTDAGFNYITGIVVSKDGNLYVMDNALRKVTTTAVVTTVNEQFTGSNLTTAPDGSLYVTRNFSGIFRYTSNGITQVNMFGVNDDCRPAVDKDGNVYLNKDMYESNVSFIPKGAVPGAFPRNLVGNAGLPDFRDGPFNTALLNYGIAGVTMGNNSQLYILDRNNYAIRLADLSSRELSTVVKASNGYEDGSFDQAKFAYGMSDIAVDKDGDIYILDKGNKAVRKIFLK